MFSVCNVDCCCVCVGVGVHVCTCIFDVGEGVGSMYGGIGSVHESSALVCSLFSGGV